jgi:hypothetical protein
MKVSGFAIVRNALLMGYPARESIESVLPICDEFIVNLGRSEDDSLALVRSIGSPKVRIVETAWEEDLRESGRVLSNQTNLALGHCTGDWAFYLQSDEVVHERYLGYLQVLMRRYLGQDRIEGLESLPGQLPALVSARGPHHPPPGQYRFMGRRQGLSPPRWLPHQRGADKGRDLSLWMGQASGANAFQKQVPGPLLA